MDSTPAGTLMQGTASSFERIATQMSVLLNRHCRGEIHVEMMYNKREMIKAAIKHGNR